MQRKNCSIFVIFLLAGILPAQQPSPQQWKEYTFPADNFGIVAPSSPRTYPDPKAEAVRIYHWDLDPGVVLTLRTGVRPGCRDTLKRIKDSKEKDRPKAFVPGSIKDVSQNELPGLESESHYPSYWLAERVYCGKNKAYSLSLSYPVNQFRPKIVDRMFNSFRLLNSSQ
jgi:hypothetical protein